MKRRTLLLHGSGRLRRQGRRPGRTAGSRLPSAQPTSVWLCKGRLDSPTVLSSHSFRGEALGQDTDLMVAYCGIVT